MENFKKFLKLFLPILLLLSVVGSAYLVLTPKYECNWWNNPDCPFDLGFSTNFVFFEIILGIPVSLFVTWIILLMRSRDHQIVTGDNSGQRKSMNSLIIILPIVLVIIILSIWLFSEYNYRKNHSDINYAPPVVYTKY